MEDLPLIGSRSFNRQVMDELYRACWESGGKPDFAWIPQGLAAKLEKELGPVKFKKWLNDEGFDDPNTHGNLSRSKD